jgi:hypothetical protein
MSDHDKIYSTRLQDKIERSTWYYVIRYRWRWRHREIVPLF